jgi:hypothetical protein
VGSKMRKQKTSNVRALGRMVCPCGWPCPVNISTLGFYPLDQEKAAVAFDCPLCGRGLSTISIKEQRS